MDPALAATGVVPPIDLSRFGRPALSSAEITAALNRGLKYRDRPSFGSGVDWLGGDDFVGVTDRGPNSDDPKVVGHEDGLLFPLPQFVPSLVQFRWRSGRITVSAVMPVHRRGGRGATGLPSLKSDGVAYDRPRAADSLPPDPSGLDIEGVRRLPDGRFLLVDEYAPSLLVTSPTGEVLKRYLPPSRAAMQQAFPADAQVPEIFAKRRQNRGFESVALSRDGRRAWTILEGPLGPRDDPEYAASRMVRVLEWNMDDPLAARPVAQYLLPLTALAETPTARRQDEIRISDAAWLSDSTLLVVERAPRRVRLRLADFASATNLLGRPEALTLAIDAASAPLSKLGITPVAMTPVFDSRDLPAFDEDNIEGLAVISDREVVVSDDNDFGIGDNLIGARARLFRLRWPAPLPRPR